MTETLLTLARIFAELSLLAFGGGNTILPEMQRQVVDVHRWMTAQHFSALFALAQAAPGPNMMVVPLVGWAVAGWRGLFVVSLAKFGPSSILTGFALHIWDRNKDRAWRKIVQDGLFPMTVGLICASAAIIAQATTRGWALAAITAVVAVLSVKTKLHPLLLLAGGALIGLTGVGQG